MGGWINSATQSLEDVPAPTQDGVAQRFVEAQAGRLRFCHDAGAWFVWTGTVWRRDRTGAVPHLIRLAARLPEGEESAKAGGTRFVAGVELFARCDPALAVTSEAWNRDPFLLGTPAGPVALGTGMRVPADPADGISLTTGVSPSDSAACPMWLAFLDEMCGGDGEIVGFIQRFLGSALTGDGAPETIVFGWGAGTAPSLFLDIVLHVMGDYARAPSAAALLSLDVERYRADRAALRGARLVALDESDDNLSWDARRLQRAGRGSGAARAPGWRLLVIGAQPPRLAIGDAGLRHHVALLPFCPMSMLPGRAALRTESPAILRWMIEGALAWRRDGLGLPAAIIDTTDDHIEAQDAIGQFLGECCLVGLDRGRTTAAALFAAWSAWAATAGEDIGSRRAFAEALSHRGFRRDRTETARFYVGIGLRETLTPDTG